MLNDINTMLEQFRGLIIPKIQSLTCCKNKFVIFEMIILAVLQVVLYTIPNQVFTTFLIDKITANIRFQIKVHNDNTLTHTCLNLATTRILNHRLKYWWICI